MRITPKSEQQVQESRPGPLPAGKYEASVLAATDEVSSKGNDMVKLILEIYHGDKKRKVFAYLLDAMEYQLRHFAIAAGLEAEYDAGEFYAEDCVGRSVGVELGIRKQDGYQDNNEVKDYYTLPGASNRSASSPNFKAGQRTAAPGKPAMAATPKESDITGDDIPFSPHPF